MNESDAANTAKYLRPTVGSADISMVLDDIGAVLGLSLTGDAHDLAGILNTDAAYRVQLLERVENVMADGDWGYYAKALAGVPGRFLKAWVRWNGQEQIYDYSLCADAGEVFSHETPSVDAIFT